MRVARAAEIVQQNCPNGEREERIVCPFDSGFCFGVVCDLDAFAISMVGRLKSREEEEEGRILLDFSPKAERKRETASPVDSKLMPGRWPQTDKAFWIEGGGGGGGGG